MRRMIRGIIDSVVEGAIKRVTMKGYVGETIADKEFFQHYGFTSRPLGGAEGVMIREGNHWILIGSDDRRYRIAIEDGEVALYTDEGDNIHFKRGRKIHVSAGTKVTFDTPLVECTGDLAVAGNISDSTRSMAADRIIYNGHNHPENDNGGPTDSPNQEM